MGETRNRAIKSWSRGNSRNVGSSQFRHNARSEMIICKTTSAPTMIPTQKPIWSALKTKRVSLDADEWCILYDGVHESIRRTDRYNCVQVSKWGLKNERARALVQRLDTCGRIYCISIYISILVPGSSAHIKDIIVGRSNAYSEPLYDIRNRQW